MPLAQSPWLAERLRWRLQHQHRLPAARAEAVVVEVQRLMAAAGDAFEETLCEVQEAFEAWVQAADQRTDSAEFKALEEASRNLVEQSLEQPRNRRHLAALLDMALENMGQVSPQTDREQVQALSSVMERLQNEEPSFSDVTECSHRLEKAGLRTLAEFAPESLMTLTRWADQPWSHEAKDLLITTFGFSVRL
jgi:hypothetical protein